MCMHIIAYLYVYLYVYVCMSMCMCAFTSTAAPERRCSSSSWDFEGFQGFWDFDLQRIQNPRSLSLDLGELVLRMVNG